jgi:hypothetical protein
LGRLRVGALLSYVLVLMGMCLVDQVVADLALAKCWRVGFGWLCVCRVLAAAAAALGGILGVCLVDLLVAGLAVAKCWRVGCG